MERKRNDTPPNRQRRTKSKFPVRSIKSLFLLCSITVAALVITIGVHRLSRTESGQIYAFEAASQNSEKLISYASLSSSLAGVMSEVQGYEEGKVRVERIGTSCEDVIVGQRTNIVSSEIPTVNLKNSMETAVQSLETHSLAAVQNPKLMSDSDYEYLLKLVEAEACGEDLKGKILIANVVMNRVNNPLFPDNVTEVIWDSSYGVAQFSPTIDGRILNMVPSEDTKEAVKQALNGIDYSQGALFFMAREQSAQENVDWFTQNLELIFTHGGHEFYTFQEKTAEQEALVLEQTVDMISQ
ncbi:MAG: cell wall hydrolase [Eubacteriales bacterium]|nr:cell wall hydrolase [Eubacteriales bacterium]